MKHNLLTTQKIRGNWNSRGRRHNTVVSRPETEERSRRRDGELDSTVEKSTIGIERLDDNGATRYFVYRSPAFHSRDEATDATTTSVAWLRRWPGDDLLPPFLIERKHFIAPCAHRLDSSCNGGPFCRLSLAFENSRGIKYPLRLHVSPYAICLSPSLSLSFYLFLFLSIILFLRRKYLSFPPEGSPKISLWRKRKRAYSGNGKCFFRSAEQSECWSWEGTRLKSVAAQQRDFSFPRSERVAFALRLLPFPQACIRDAGSSPLNPSYINTVLK